MNVESLSRSSPQNQNGQQPPRKQNSPPGLSTVHSLQVFQCLKEKSKFLYNPFFLLSLLWMFAMSHSPRKQEIVQQSKILVHYFRINIMAKMTGLPCKPLRIFCSQQENQNNSNSLLGEYNHCQESGT